ncbi:efflux RND transporter periplasmic adaptor subunit [uncultured Lamprocystis sp.]|jgi:HlyD family secretion protein|uniref:efflux RND transporter periplasmic adaptor subunit n=1 Tax=uncultured Lamprocystis sp. TaxID=543132 RepID=UPI0025E2CF16|nr:efflux RND transporter periplasmic adaptor subunit [uncultured Lamprocystis sp.]
MTTPESAAEIARQIGTDGRPSRRRRVLFWLAGLTLLAAAGAAATLLKDGTQEQVRFRTAAVERGDLTVKVSATGQLQPVTQVEVGTEVSGTIDRVEVDFNDRVRTGQILARLDPDQSQAKFRQSRAALTLAQAGVEEAQATVTETAGKLRRVRDMVAKRMSSGEELDTAAAAAERAVAALAVAKAKVEQAQAQLDADHRTLEKTEIRSPIDGTVLKRQVEPGQTVAASLQTPVLFTLAEDLTQMELNVAVDEADVGQVAAGQSAEFTVDAYPNRRFPATITQVRFAPETVGGVVTYAALLALDNADLSLRPGMTATAEIVVKALSDVVLVPNTALRFSPPQPRPAKSADLSLVGMLLPSRPPEARRLPRAAAPGQGPRVWTLQDGTPTPLDIKTGATDGNLTEVLDGALEPGTVLLVDVERTAAKP